jgi:hypothetical protein
LIELISIDVMAEEFLGLLAARRKRVRLRLPFS